MADCSDFDGQASGYSSMLRKSQFSDSSSACRGRACWVVALLSAAALASGLMGAQPPPAVPAPEAPSTLPKVPLSSPRSLPEVRSFVEDLSRNDAVLEIVVGQARILTIR